MSTYTQLTYQVVFGGKYRHKFLPESHQDELFKYMGGVLRNLGCLPFIQGGYLDHVHLVFSPSNRYSISRIVKEVKISTNKFLRDRNDKFPNFIAWQIGYGAFSYSLKDRNNVVKYVMNQKKHHEGVSFEREYKRLLIEHCVEFDEKYLFC